jgi:aspartyl-tRNA(Asn)/glutamyl-tRNA(Gln) amidotransferase subunit C
MTRSSIDRTAVRRIARLARLELDDAAVRELAGELRSILDSVALLDELDLAAVPPAARPGQDARAALREDDPTPGLDAADALANAPDAAHGCFRVPRVIAE